MGQGQALGAFSVVSGQHPCPKGLGGGAHGIWGGLKAVVDPTGDPS